MTDKTDTERLAGVRRALKEWYYVLEKNGYVGGLSNGWFDSIDKEANGK